MEEHEFADSSKTKNEAETGVDTGEGKATTEGAGFMKVPAGEESPFE